MSSASFYFFIYFPNMLYTINELRHHIFQPVYDVYEIFQNFFDEEHVDLQDMPTDEAMVNAVYSCTEIMTIEPQFPIEFTEDDITCIRQSFSTWVAHIYVWWPEVTITNENDKSVDIQDLYAQVAVSIEGHIPYEFPGFLLNRTTFSELQFSTGYVHSHVPSISNNRLPIFQNPCLGTGPIRNTIADLKNNYEEALWMLFCQELSLYVTVESLRGVPYRKLEQLGDTAPLHSYSCYNLNRDIYLNPFVSGILTMETLQNLICSFTMYYLEQTSLILSFENEKYCCKMPYFDFMIDISNAFIDFFNKFGSSDVLAALYSSHFLIETFVKGREFHKPISMGNSSLHTMQGRHVLTFKGQSIPLKIFKSEVSEDRTTTLLCQDIAMYILKNILKIINYHYGDNITRNQEGEQSSSSSCKTVLYL